jgi:hypothetical protein
MNRPRLTRVDVCARLIDQIGQLRERRATRLRTRPGPSDALRALCTGSITVEEYLNRKLDLALRPLEVLLRPEDIAAVRVAMSERILSEPIWRCVAEELRTAVAREHPERGDADDC